MSFLKSIAGDVIGGVGSYYGAKEQANAARDVNAAQIHHSEKWNKINWSANRDKFKNLVNDAKAMGISPAVALGVNGGGAAPVAMPGLMPEGTRTGAAANAIGQTAQRIGRRWNDAQVRKAEAEANQAEIDYRQARLDLAKQQATAQAAIDNAEALGTLNNPYDKYIYTSDNLQKVLPEGVQVWMNPEVAESISEMGPSAITYSAQGRTSNSAVYKGGRPGFERPLPVPRRKRKAFPFQR